MSKNRLDLERLYDYIESDKDQYLSPYLSCSPISNSETSNLNSKHIRNNSLWGVLELKFSQYDTVKVPEFKLEKEDLIREKAKTASLFASPSPRSANKDISFRIKRELFSTPIKKIKFRSPTTFNNNLGPGEYSPSKNKPISGGYFSTQPRFDESFEDKIEWLLSKRRKRNLSFSNKISERNRDMTQHSPEKKIKIHWEKMYKHKITLETVKEAKRRIDKMRRESKENKLKDKMQKFMFNEKRAEFKQIYISWVVLGSIIGLHTILYYKAETKKVINMQRRWIRVRKQITLLYLVSRILGKLKMILLKNRRLILTWKLSKIVVRIKKWVNNRRSLHLKILNAEIFKKKENQSTLFELMVLYWKYKNVLNLGLKSIVEIKKARLNALNLLWNKIQANLIKNYRNNGKIKVDKPEKLIPQKAIEENLKKYFYAQAKSYLEKYIKYKAECREIDEYKERELKEIAFDALLSENAIYQHTEWAYPRAPTFTLYSSENLLKKHIMQVIHFYAISNCSSPQNLNRMQRRSIQIPLDEYARFQNKLKQKDQSQRRRPSHFAIIYFK